MLLGEDDSSMHADLNGSSSPAPKQAGARAKPSEAQKQEDVPKSGAAKVTPHIYYIFYSGAWQGLREGESSHLSKHNFKLHMATWDNLCLLCRHLL